MTSTISTTKTRRLPPVTYVLAAGVFLMGTTEFIVAGILPEIAGDLEVSVASAGLMITVFAVGMIVGTPTMSILTLKLPRRLTLSLALVVFAAGHVVVAMTSDFTLVLAARAKEGAANQIRGPFSWYQVLTSAPPFEAPSFRNSRADQPAPGQGAVLTLSVRFIVVSRRMLTRQVVPG